MDPSRPTLNMRCNDKMRRCIVIELWFATAKLHAYAVYSWAEVKWIDRVGSETQNIFGISSGYYRFLFSCLPWPVSVFSLFSSIDRRAVWIWLFRYFSLTSLFQLATLFYHYWILMFELLQSRASTPTIAKQKTKYNSFALLLYSYAESKLIRWTGFRDKHYKWNK